MDETETRVEDSNTSHGKTMQIVQFVHCYQLTNTTTLIDPAGDPSSDVSF
jgi:hypothetical protein